MAISSSTSSACLLPVFLESNIDTRLIVIVSADDTVASLKRIVEKEHVIAFPDMGEVMVKTVKKKIRGLLYNLSDSMILKYAFIGTKGNWFLKIEAMPVTRSKDQESSIENANNQNILKLGRQSCKENGIFDEKTLLPSDPINYSEYPFQKKKSKRKAQFESNSNEDDKGLEENSIKDKQMHIENPEETNTQAKHSDVANIGVDKIVETKKKRRKRSNQSQNMKETQTNLVTDNANLKISEGNEAHEPNAEPHDNQENANQSVLETENPIPEFNQGDSIDTITGTTSETKKKKSRKEKKKTKMETPFESRNEEDDKVLEDNLVEEKQILSENPEETNNQDNNDSLINQEEINQVANEVPEVNIEVNNVETKKKKRKKSNESQNMNEVVFETQDDLFTDNSNLMISETKQADETNIESNDNQENLNQVIIESENPIPESSQGDATIIETKKEKSRKEKKKAKKVKSSSEVPLIRETEGENYINTSLERDSFIIPENPGEIISSNPNQVPEDGRNQTELDSNLVQNPFKKEKKKKRRKQEVESIIEKESDPMVNILVTDDMDLMVSASKEADDQNIEPNDNQENIYHEVMETKSENAIPVSDLGDGISENSILESKEADETSFEPHDSEQNGSQEDVETENLTPEFDQVGDDVITENLIPESNEEDETIIEPHDNQKNVDRGISEPENPNPEFYQGGTDTIAENPVPGSKEASETNIEPNESQQTVNQAIMETENPIPVSDQGDSIGTNTTTETKKEFSIEAPLTRENESNNDEDNNAMIPEIPGEIISSSVVPNDEVANDDANPSQEPKKEINQTQFSFESVENLYKKKKKRKQEVESTLEKKFDEMVNNEVANNDVNPSQEPVKEINQTQLGFKLVENLDKKKKKKRKEEVESMVEKESDEIVNNEVANDDANPSQEPASEINQTQLGSQLVENLHKKKRKKRKQEVESMAEKKSDEMVNNEMTNDDASLSQEPDNEINQSQLDFELVENLYKKKKKIVKQEGESMDEKEFYEGVNDETLLSSTKKISNKGKKSKEKAPLVEVSENMSERKEEANLKDLSDDGAVLSQKSSAPKMVLDLGAIFRSSRSYKKAKVSASQSQVEDEN